MKVQRGYNVFVARKEKRILNRKLMMWFSSEVLSVIDEAASYTEKPRRTKIPTCIYRTFVLKIVHR